MEEIIENKLLPLKREKIGEEKLKIFFMGIRPFQFSFIGNERFIGIVAFDEKEALKKATELYLKDTSNMMVLSHSEDFEYIDNLLKHLDLKSLDGNPLIIEKPVYIDKPIQQITIGKESFITGLKMAKEEFIKNENDKKELERIINTIDIKV